MENFYDIIDTPIEPIVWFNLPEGDLVVVFRKHSVGPRSITRGVVTKITRKKRLARSDKRMWFMWRNFESNMFRFSAASSIVVQSLASRHLQCLRLPTKRDRHFPIFGVVNLWHTSVSSTTTIEVFLFYTWYKLIENCDLNFLFFTC